MLWLRIVILILVIIAIFKIHMVSLETRWIRDFVTTTNASSECPKAAAREPSPAPAASEGKQRPDAQDSYDTVGVAPTIAEEIVMQMAHGGFDGIVAPRPTSGSTTVEDITELLEERRTDSSASFRPIVDNNSDADSDGAESVHEETVAAEGRNSVSEHDDSSSDEDDQQIMLTE